ncbi:MAG: tripartite tricarboxylate transporter substrate binding protein [Betaproteobacteria bacterium]|nr:tripartite tricarboxylate transporter substrate binding protein [Betaproteobacteria bacterium]
MLARMLAVASAFASMQAIAQAYPSKPVNFIVAFAAGGDSDLSGRNLAQHAGKYLNSQSIVVINRVGASGAIGSMAVRTAPADGYTLLVARIATHAILPATDPNTPYKWNEFTMLSLLELNPFVCVVKGDSPFKNMPALAATIRNEPGKLNFSTSGIGTVQNLGPQYFFSLLGLSKDAAVGIHYKGGGEVTTSLLGGQVHFACNNLTTLLSHIKSGTLRALMITTPERLKELPDVPTSRELGWPEMEKITGWSALMGPPGLPREVTDKWAEVLAKIAQDPEWLAGNARLGGIPSIRSPSETETFVREQYELYERLAISIGIRQ